MEGASLAALFLQPKCDIICAMKGNALKANKSVVRRQKEGRLSATAVRRKVKRTFAEQVDVFIERYRPALEALAKR